MSVDDKSLTGFRMPILQGLLPIKCSQVPAEVIFGLTDVGETGRYRLRELYGEDAFCDTLNDVVRDYQKQTE